jgi:squalene synthase HpnC
VVAQDPYDVCLRIARGHYENFPVASWLLPRNVRPHIAAIYAFSRRADDIADEGTASPADRLAALDRWQDHLRVAVTGRPIAAEAETAAIFAALANTIRTRSLPVALFEDLLSAFRQDVTVKRYAEWNDVLDYCRRSANPVGRLVLGVFNYRDAMLDACSDAICTALQLTNFWQDFARDWKAGRLYLPASWIAAAGAHESDLDRGVMTAEWRGIFSRATERTRALFAAGRPLPDFVGGRLRWELRATWLGGTTILDRIERSGFDVFQFRPTLGWPDLFSIVARTASWRRSAPVVPSS